MGVAVYLVHISVIAYSLTANHNGNSSTVTKVASVIAYSLTANHNEKITIAIRRSSVIAYSLTANHNACRRSWKIFVV